MELYALCLTCLAPERDPVMGPGPVVLPPPPALHHAGPHTIHRYRLVPEDQRERIIFCCTGLKFSLRRKEKATTAATEKVLEEDRLP